jgi:hypothetical protein
MRIRFLPLAALLAALPILGLTAQDKKPGYAGATADGFLLPNGWKLKPAGEHLVLTDLPLNIVPLPGGKQALVATSGYNRHELSLVDLTTGKVLDKQAVRQSWFGLALDASSQRVWWAGGGADMLHTFELRDRKLTRTGPPEPPLPEKKAATKPLPCRCSPIWKHTSATASVASCAQTSLIQPRCRDLPITQPPTAPTASPTATDTSSVRTRKYPQCTLDSLRSEANATAARSAARAKPS